MELKCLSVSYPISSELIIWHQLRSDEIRWDRLRSDDIRSDERRSDQMWCQFLGVLLCGSSCGSCSGSCKSWCWWLLLVCWFFLLLMDLPKAAYQVSASKHAIFSIQIGCPTGWVGGWWFLLKLRISKGWLKIQSIVSVKSIWLL